MQPPVALDARTARILPWLVAIAFFMQTLDGTILNTALPAMARDLAVSVERGDIRGASFAFTVAPGGDRWTVADDRVTRDLLDLDLHEITITATPAYPDTEVARRALATLTAPRLRVARRWMETL